MENNMKGDFIVTSKCTNITFGSKRGSKNGSKLADARGSYVLRTGR